LRPTAWRIAFCVDSNTRGVAGCLQPVEGNRQFVLTRQGPCPRPRLQIPAS
jgi:hypothetical protein